jgi:hypothetical protein
MPQPEQLAGQAAGLAHQPLATVHEPQQAGPAAAVVAVRAAPPTLLPVRTATAAAAAAWECRLLLLQQGLQATVVWS